MSITLLFYSGTKKTFWRYNFVCIKTSFLFSCFCFSQHRVFGGWVFILNLFHFLLCLFKIFQKNINREKNFKFWFVLLEVSTIWNDLILMLLLFPQTNKWLKNISGHKTFRPVSSYRYFYLFTSMYFMSCRWRVFCDKITKYAEIIEIPSAISLIGWSRKRHAIIIFDIFLFFISFLVTFCAKTVLTVMICFVAVYGSEQMFSWNIFFQVCCPKSKSKSIPLSITPEKKWTQHFKKLHP